MRTTFDTQRKARYWQRSGPAPGQKLGFDGARIIRNAILNPKKKACLFMLSVSFSTGKRQLEAEKVEPSYHGVGYYRDGNRPIRRQIINNQSRQGLVP